MMWAYFVKDVKENARWALLGAVVLSKLFAFLLYNERFQRMSIVYDGYQVNVSIACAVAGIALGLATMLTDMRRGHWGFAVHRPVQRWKIFAAKFMAAALVYLVATFVASGVAILCAMNSRYVNAPFAAPMVLPQLYYALNGLLWLAAGMLVATRQARWIGSRVFPLVLPLVVSVAIMQLSQSFYVATLAVVMATAIIALAAGIYFVRNGQYVSQPTWAKPLQTLIVASGAVMLITIGSTMLAEVTRIIRGEASQYHRSMYTVDSQGHAYRREDDAYFTVQGVPLSPATTKWLSDDRFDAVSVMLNKKNAPGERNYESLLSGQSYLQSFSQYSDTGKYSWSFVPSRRTIEGLDPVGNFAGSIGPDGFRDSSQPPLPFPAGSSLPRGPYDYSTDVIVSNDTTVFVVNLTDRDVHKVFTNDAATPLIDAGVFRRTLPDTIVRSSTDLFDPKRPGYIAVVTHGRLRVLPLANSDPAFDLPINTDRDGTIATLGLVDDGGLRVLVTDFWSKYPAELLARWTGRPGVDLTLPVLPRPAAVLTPSDALQLAALPPIGLAIGAAIAWSGLAGPDAFGPLPPGLAWVMIVATLAAIALTAWAARRMSLSRVATIAWLVLALLFGLCAPLTLICLRPRPLRVGCPACGKQRPIDCDRCPHCDAPFPTPGDPATDIFDDARAAA